MVKIVRYVLVDDIDGSPAQETVRFAVGRESYEIELNEVHLAQFHESMRRWIERARIVGDFPAVPATESTPSRSPNAPEIRRWAAKRGIPVAARGRIPDSVRRQYYAERVGSAVDSR